MPRTLSRIWRWYGALRQAVEQCAGEGGAAPRLLVLEVDVHALPARSIADAPRPCLDVRVRIVRAPEAEIPEGGGRDRRRGQVLAVRDAECGPVLGKKRVGRVREPALVPELEGRLQPRRERREEVGEAWMVGPEVGRQLEQKRPELRAELTGGPAELGGHRLSVAQT